MLPSEKRRKANFEAVMKHIEQLAANEAANQQSSSLEFPFLNPSNEFHFGLTCLSVCAVRCEELRSWREYAPWIQGIVELLQSFDVINTLRKQKDIRVIITDPMQRIVDTWGNPKRPDNFIFPILNGKETALEQKKKTQYLTRAINRRMKSIAENLGIDHISTYTARHSFATVLKRSGASIAYISEALGHQDLNTT